MLTQQYNNLHPYGIGKLSLPKLAGKSIIFQEYQS
jgi:hypothetical protein